MGEAERQQRYTPGPWRAKGQEVKGVMGVGVAFCGESSTHGSDGSYRVGPKEAESNARLTAAAPELLEALEDLVHQVDRDNKPEWLDLDEAKAAIAKAYGETP